MGHLSRCGLALTALALLACSRTPRLLWPAEVRAAEERGPLIRPPETGWSHRDAAEAFHARGWDTLTESWISDPAHGRVGHCWTGAVRTIGAAGGDVVASDLTEHGLPDARLGETVQVGPLAVTLDDHTFAACLAEPRVEDAVSGLAGDCAAFGEAIAVLDDAVRSPARSAELAMNAIELTLLVRWSEPELPADLTIRRLARLGFTGVSVRETGSPPRMRRVDDDWTVEVDLPAPGESEVVLRALTRVPRRPICGPEPLVPRRSGS